MLTFGSILQSSPVYDQLRTIVNMVASEPNKRGQIRRTHAPTRGGQNSTLAIDVRPRKRGVRRPDTGSLNDIMRQHCGSSLYVLPICWTDLHARVLGVEFVAQDPILTPVPAATIASSSRRGYQPRPSQTAAALSRELTTLISPEEIRPFWKARALKAVLSTLYPATLNRPKSGAELDLHFGDRVFRKAIRVPVVWRHPDAAGTSFDSAVTRPATSFNRIPASSRDSSGGNSNSSSWACNSSQAAAASAPMLAYINRTQLALIRQNLFRVVPGPKGGDEGNTPVTRLQQLRSKQLIPAEADHDSYVFAVLLAMAQSHFYGDNASWPSSQQSNRDGSYREGRPTTPVFHDVKVHLLTHDDDASEFIVYKAVVSAAFLERFSRPARVPLDPHGLKIEYVRVPIWPVLGLKERLGKALGREIAGDIPEDDDSGAGGGGSMETWESQEERTRRLSSLKRRRAAEREVLVEVLSSSFEVEDEVESDTDAHGTLSPHSKRRCTNPVLEVC